MKKYYVILIAIITLFIVTSCDLNSNKNLVLPKTIEEVETLIKVVPNCIYEIEDVINTEYDEEVPEGVQMTLLGSTSKDFFLGVRFLDEESLNNAYDEMKELIEEAIIYEFDQDKDSFKIYSNDLWMYAGSKDFVSYFEGKSDKLLTKEELVVPFDTIETRLKNEGFEVSVTDVLEDSYEYKEYGCRKVIIATNSTSKEVITIYQMTSNENCMEFRSDLIDSLEEKYYDDLLSKLDWEISHTKYGTYANYIYVGTEIASTIIKGEK